MAPPTFTRFAPAGTCASGQEHWAYQIALRRRAVIVGDAQRAQLRLLRLADRGRTLATIFGLSVARRVAHRDTRLRDGIAGVAVAAPGIIEALDAFVFIPVAYNPWRCVAVLKVAAVHACLELAEAVHALLAK